MKTHIKIALFCTLHIMHHLYIHKVSKPCLTFSFLSVAERKVAPRIKYKSSLIHYT